MSKSLKRVRTVLQTAGLDAQITQTDLARTARDAALAVGCEVDQIAKSIIFQGQTSGQAVLFITAGGRTVDPARASALADEPLGRADPALVRAQTGFAIGGVSPVGHLSPIRAWFDQTLLAFDQIWAAAGTPHHVFCLSPAQLLQISGAQLSDFTSEPAHM